MKGAARALIAALAASLALGAAGCSRFVVLHDPLSAAEHNDLGVAYESAGRMELAEREFRKAVRLEPARSIAWVNLGNVLAAKGRLAQAERCYRSALRANPGDLDAMNNLAVSLVRRNRRLDEAEDLARRALAGAAASSPERDSLYRATLAEVLGARQVANPPAP